MLEHFATRDFLDAMDIYYSTEKAKRPTGWRYSLIGALDMIEGMGEDEVRANMGAEKFDELMGRS